MKPAEEAGFLWSILNYEGDYGEKMKGVGSGIGRNFKWNGLLLKVSLNHNNSGHFIE